MSDSDYKLGEAQEKALTQYEGGEYSRPTANITFEVNDVRTLMRIYDLGLDDSGIIEHIFNSIRLDYPSGV